MAPVLWSIPPAAEGLGASLEPGDAEPEGVALGDAGDAPVLLQATAERSRTGVRTRDASRRGWFDMAAGRGFGRSGSEMNLRKPHKTT